MKENKKQMNLMILWIVLLYPYERMSTAGWAATTVNYVWPLSLGLFSLLSIRKMWDGEKINFLSGFFYVISSIFACNQELCCGILLITYLFFAVILTVRDKKKVNKLIFLPCYTCKYITIVKDQKLNSGLCLHSGVLNNIYIV